MSRRVRTLLVAGGLFIVLAVLSLTLPVPYVVLSPGPTYNTLGTDPQGNEIIVIHGRTANATTGNLNMTTVDVSTQPLTVFTALDGWLMHDQVVVPRSAIITPGKSQTQVDKENTQAFVTSQDSAEAAAFCQLGYPKGFGIRDVTPKGPSDGVLLPGDEFVSLDGVPVATFAQLSAELARLQPGQTVDVVVKRGGHTVTEKVTLAKPLSGRKGASLGVEVTNGCLAPFTVDLGLANQIGGPSAGLMFALGIMAKTGTQNLTGGKFIAGTGTIDPDGIVGPIGGIQLKMVAARDKGATVFLAPAANCSDVRADTPKGLTVVKVTNLSDAVHSLLALQSGGAVPHC